MEISFGSRRIIFCSNDISELLDSHVLVVQHIGLEGIAKLWQIFLTTDLLRCIYVSCRGGDALPQAFLSYYPNIRAGGGLVEASTGELLLIHRRGVWDLPKGKLEENETLEACALREVEEETGAKGLSIVAPLHDTYHVFLRDDKPYIKHTGWFHMQAPDATPLAPQTEEEITEAIWATPQHARELTAESFHSVRTTLAALTKRKEAKR